MSLQSVQRITQCPVCLSSQFSTFYTISHAPAHVGILWRSKEEALHCLRGDIELACCSDCGFISNIAFDSSLMEYTEEYDNSLHFSKYYQNYAESVAKRLVEDYQLYDKKIIEIGSGKGDFLSFICKIGKNYGTGFDPSYRGNLSPVQSSDRITFIRDYYSANYSHYQGDLICSRHVFEHIPNPFEFLTALRSTINGQGNHPILYFEVPNILLILKDLSVWDIIYEHCSYFGAASLERVFNLSKFDTIKLFESFGNQCIGIEATPARDVGKSLARNSDKITELLTLVRDFSHKCKIKLEEWENTLQHIEQNNEGTVIWGAGSKSVSFLNILNIKDQITYVVDINPRKRGCYIPGTGQKIILPEELKNHIPDNVIVMNPLYKQEIQQQLNSLGLNPKLLFAI
ncbi:MAG: methyltransferase domain-containing protein [Candidatus Jettenia sp.]|uniref:Putative methyltransferase n=1 Tax=Candidatus Jettenia caeni TaxID=247490 RepID=I3INJ9_9BACT|nr:class I SAM-dependent methyltransferase [Candidatus Jettenia sp. AMX1]MBC6929357.1 methyltransferase domain-containing protein [Candidatus Jettenia sp.]GAB63294.1 putative methyltransferase [Candidatus Jettenia caeni]KAA0249103.1 MAG: methyltransferase domain-containing protein [Candidatus Jettenia sp. AMX1]MCE7881867.1 methyltransferase domain-containing protein [Candidatus Jettenia sp. AMX1]MCQ3927017.1 methyltransferase domain-containing protein [Candidatus Jettenia sp.]